jgi:hypothetical protein
LRGQWSALARLEPTARFETSHERDVLEGRLTGTIRNGPLAGSPVFGRYVLKPGRALKRGDVRRREVGLVIDLWAVQGCLAIVSTSAGEPPRSSTVTTTSPDFKKRLPAKYTEEEWIKLSDKFYRPLSALPKNAVEAFTKAEGGPLTPRAIRDLQRADHNFLSLDKNGDAALDIKELEALYSQSQFKLPKKNARRLKRQDAALRRSSVAKGFSEADTDQDGKISFTEFVLWRRGWKRIQIAP